MQELIRFPSGMDPRYSDSGEGGIFVMMLVPEPDDHSDNCHVDVEITLSRPDVCVSSGRTRELWEPYDSKDSGFHKSMEAQKVLEAAGKPDLASWALRTTSPDDHSVSMLAAVHVGSTHESLWDARMGAYWQATPDDLTDAGRALYAALEGAHGIKPMLITFLDT